MAETIDTEGWLTASPDAPPAAVRWARRKRRPSGAPPPLPRKLGISGGLWLGLIVFVFVSTVLFLSFQPTVRFGDQVDTWGLKVLAHVRTPWLTHLMRAIKAVGSGWALTVIGLGTVSALMIFRRWRHLLVFFGSLFVLGQLATIIFDLLSRPRPYGVRIIGGWSGFSMPSPPVAVFATIAVGMLYAAVVPGRPRNLAKWCVWILIAILGLSRLYLAVDHPSDVVFGIILGVGIPVALFRFFVPNEVFPVSYKRPGNVAHLDVTGTRGDAIRRAVHDQLGLTILDVKPFGEEGSGGSTPLRLRVQGDPDTYLFAKLYAQNHVRADRWYKIWRTILYGRLEDEASFQNVRRFVEYEDDTLRLLRDSGIPTPTPYGIVEITPEREYMIVMEFFAGAKEIGEAEVDERIIDQGLELVRKLWDTGAAHRDIKPANLMVRDGKVLLIDVFFVQVRPSPWRQAVDLANMMLVLAVRSDPDRVYERALRFFTPDEIGEAFAATRGVASPTQLRAFMKRDGRDLLSRFRALAPARRPVALQRWSVRRVAIAVAMFGAIIIAVYGGVSAFLPSQNGSRVAVAKPPECGTGHVLTLMAQAVPFSDCPPLHRYAAVGMDVRGGSVRGWPGPILARLGPSGRPSDRGHAGPGLRRSRSPRSSLGRGKSAAIRGAGEPPALPGPANLCIRRRMRHVRPLLHRRRFHSRLRC
jgi:tRNA A-37 threonylcarbamoyl transferase component Bud32/membrane-associated phospholipid phosphatase